LGTVFGEPSASSAEPLSRTVCSPDNFFLNRIGNYTTSHSVEYMSGGGCFEVASGLLRLRLAMTSLAMTSLAMTFLLTTTIIKKSWVISVNPCLPVPTDPYGQAGASNFFTLPQRCKHTFSTTNLPLRRQRRGSLFLLCVFVVNVIFSNFFP